MFEERSLQSLVKEYHLTRKSAKDMFRALFNLLMARSIGFGSVRQGIYGVISETRVAPGSLVIEMTCDQSIMQKSMQGIFRVAR